MPNGEGLMDRMLDTENRSKWLSNSKSIVKYWDAKWENEKDKAWRKLEYYIENLKLTIFEYFKGE